MPKPRRPRFARADNAPIHVTKDDLDLLAYTASRRFARMSDIIRHLPHRSAKHLRGRTRKLYDHGYLDLPHAQKDDHVTAGRPEKIYALADRGAALLAELRNFSAPKSSWSDKNRGVGRKYLHHELRIGDVKEAVHRLPRFVPTAHIMTAAHILAGAPPTTTKDPKPWLWQTKVSTEDGSLRTVSAVPDDVFGIDLTDRRQRWFYFLEADNSTEPVVRTTAGTSLARKFEAYLAGIHAQLHRSRYGLANLRILTVTSSQERIETMLAALAALAGDKDCSMFLFADFHQIKSANHILAVPWRNGRGAPASLLD